jgi:transposase
MKTETISERELDGLIERLRQAKEEQLALTASDIDLVLNIVLSFSFMQENMSNTEQYVEKLQKIAGLARQTEKFKDIVGKGKENPDEKKEKSPRKKPEKPVIHNTEKHELPPELKKGQRCPDCERGNLKKCEPGVFIRVSGHSPLLTTQHLSERVRCGSCEQYFTAELPEEVKADGEPGQMYGYSARALMAIYRYFGGLPFHRQESINHLLAISVSASTVFNQCEYVANAANPIFNHLKKVSAEAVSFQTDDTTNRILSAGVEQKPDRRSGKPKDRKGVYTSGVIGVLENGREIVLFQTNIGYAGEWLDELLKGRQSTAPPVIMSDASSNNNPSLLKEYHRSLCNVHARRGFVEVYRHFPDKVEWFLKKYALIWDNEEKWKDLPSDSRLSNHAENSLPVLKEMKSWCHSQLESKEVEENSGLGKAMKYFIKHFNGLSLFCRVEGAKVDNNVMESTLKLVIRGRKNSLFHKTQEGADVADVLSSLIATCIKNGVNALDYLTSVQRFSDEVRKNPGQWLPWNYKIALAEHQKHKITIISAA